MTPEVPREAIQAEVDRVLASETFRGAERSRALLRFIVDEAMQGRADRLKDYVLGAEALGRGEAFDPRTDPVARVEASRLRSRLDVYYATEGAGDPVRIALPKGRYAPAFEPRRPDTPPPAGGRRQRSTMSIAAVAVGVALVAAAGGWQVGRSRVPAPAERWLEMVTPATADSISFAISPDGNAFVHVASTSGRAQLWLRAIDDDPAAARLLEGTEYASLPFWAPDGRSIGFFADTRVKRIDLDTGLVRTVSTAVVPAGGTWSRDGVILHPMVPDSGLFRTSIDGAPLEPATEMTDGQTGHRGPVFLPDGRRFLFYASGDPSVKGLYVGELGTRTARRLLDVDAPAVLAPPGHLLYVRRSLLFLHRFDPDRAVLIGDPVRLADDISIDPSSGAAAIAASSGAIVFRTGAPAGKRQFMWVDRAGGVLSRIGSPEPRGGSYVALAPDGARLAVTRSVSGNTDIWLMDMAGRQAPFTADPRPDIVPHWSPGGDRIVYSSIREGAFQLIEKALGGEPRVLLGTPEMKQVTDWSYDGGHLLFRTVAFLPGFDTDIWALPLEGDLTPIPVVRTDAEERDAQWSPDGTLIAYQSNVADGRHEIFVKPFHGAGEPQRISMNGGVQVRWAPDGRELYYLNLRGELVAVAIARAPDGRSLTVNASTPLFHANTGPLQSIAQQSYLPSPDGARFLMDVVIEETPPPLRVILNWTGRGQK